MSLTSSDLMFDFGMTASYVMCCLKSFVMGSELGSSLTHPKLISRHYKFRIRSSSWWKRRWEPKGRSERQWKQFALYFCCITYLWCTQGKTCKRQSSESKTSKVQSGTPHQVEDMGIEVYGFLCPATYICSQDTECSGRAEGPSRNLLFFGVHNSVIN